MRSRIFLGCVPAMLVAGPALALPNGGPLVEPVDPTPAEVSARRADPGPSAAFLEAAMITRQDEAAAAPAETSTPPMQAAPVKQPTLHVFVFYEDREFDTLTIDPDDSSTGGEVKFDVSKTEQKRTGLGMAFGGRTIKGYFRLFQDELKINDPAGGRIDFDGWGGGGGVAGSPSLKEINPDTHLTLPYRGDFTMAFDTADAVVGGTELDMLYLESRLEIGIGVNWRGLHPSLGVQATTDIGFITDDIGNNNVSEDFVLTGFNPGFYAGIAYKHPEFPVFIDLRFLGGDVAGWTGALGASF